MADASPAPSRATLYPIERALVNTAVACVTCRSRSARVLLVWRLSRILVQIPGEPEGPKLSDAEAAALREANDIRFGPLARVESSAAHLVRLYRKGQAHTLAQVNAAVDALGDALALYFIDRSDVACETIGIALDAPPAVIEALSTADAALTA